MFQPGRKPFCLWGNVEWSMRGDLVKLGEDKAGKLCAEMLLGKYRDGAANGGC